MPRMKGYGSRSGMPKSMRTYGTASRRKPRASMANIAGKGKKPYSSLFPRKTRIDMNPSRRTKRNGRGKRIS